MSPDTEVANPTGPAFTEADRAALKERSLGLKKASRASSKTPANGTQEVLGTIAAMAAPDRGMPERIHAIVTHSVPELTPRTWYGMPAYATGQDVILFFQDAAKFKARHATLGFSDKAAPDDGAMWPSSYALSVLIPEVEEHARARVRQAAG